MQAHAAPLDVYAERAARELDPRAQAALAQMPQDERRLLAIRGYVKSGEHFGDRWSWTAAQIDQYQNSRDRALATADLDRIRTRFAAMNPGYTLRVNTEVRSLDVQIERWNANSGVGKTAAALQRAAFRELNSSAYSAEPNAASLERFRHFLQTWQPSPAAPLAVPGLSRHGQARAFDFHILRGDRIVASTDMGIVKSVWDGQGWTAKLKAAVAAGSDRFRGPLAAPYEPWHYEYSNDATLADSQPVQRERA
ncbi:MAG: hypothetical protein ABW110_16560, partial [Steroidobacteraceae bacterium]